MKIIKRVKREEEERREKKRLVGAERNIKEEEILNVERELTKNMPERKIVVEKT